MHEIMIVECPQFMQPVHIVHITFYHVSGNDSNANVRTNFCCHAPFRGSKKFAKSRAKRRRKKFCGGSRHFRMSMKVCRVRIANSLERENVMKLCPSRIDSKASSFDLRRFGPILQKTFFTITGSPSNKNFDWCTRCVRDG